MANDAPSSFHSRESIAAGVARIAGELAEAALTRISHPTADPEDDVHEIRLSIKRLRAFLLLIRPVAGDERYEREDARLQQAARVLAPSRDLAVARKTLTALGKKAGRRRDRLAFAKVLTGIHKKALFPYEADHGKALRAVAAALRQSRKAIPRLCRGAREWEIIGPGLEAVYRACRKRMKRAFDRDREADFHRWRTRGKGLFYQLQLLEPAWPAEFCGMLRRLDKLQKKLGDDHDLTVVQSLLEAEPEAFGGACAVQRVTKCLQRRSRKLRKCARKLGKALFARKPRKFIDECEAHWRQWRKPASP